MSVAYWTDEDEAAQVAADEDFSRRLRAGEVDFATDPYLREHGGNEIVQAEIQRYLAPKWRPAKCKTGYAMSLRWKIVHRVRSLESLTENGRVYYATRWMCGDGCSTDVVLIADPSLHGGVCPRCDSVLEGCIVYRCFGAQDRLLYIGSTNNRHQRMQIHSKRSPWWPQVARIETEKHPDIWAARTAETLAIATELPHYNKRGKPTAPFPFGGAT